MRIVVYNLRTTDYGRKYIAGVPPLCLVKSRYQDKLKLASCLDPFLLSENQHRYTL